MRTVMFGCVLALATTAFALEPATPADEDHVKVAGVVSKIDHRTNTITIVTPLSETEAIDKVGSATIIDRDYNLVAIRASYAKDEKIERDGKSVRPQDLKEGDFIRTSYDSNADSFGEINAMSQAELKKQWKEDKKELKKDLKKDLKDAEPQN